MKSGRAQQAIAQSKSSKRGTDANTALLRWVACLGIATLLAWVVESELISSLSNAPSARSLSRCEPKLGLAACAASREDATSAPPSTSKTPVAAASPRVAGSVTDRRGTAIDGALICAGARDVRWDRDSCTESTAGGKFVLSTARPYLFASARGFISTTMPIDAAASEPLRVVLDRGDDPIRGWVVDAAGGPIALAQIDARPEGGSSEPLPTWSDVRGAFSVSAPPGPTELWARADGYAPARVVVVAPTNEARLVLSPASSISGMVVDALTRAGLASALVTARASQAQLSMPATTLTDSEGRFTFSLPAGAYELEAMTKAARTERTWVAVDFGASADGVELLARHATTLSAEILLSGARCPVGELELSGPSYAIGSTSSRGQVTLEGLPPGDYALVASCDGAVSVEQSLRIGPDPIALHFDLEPGLRLRGRVVSSSGRPIADAQIRVRRVDVSPEHALSSTFDSRCSSDERGNFVCAGLVEGEYDCSAWVGAGTRTEPLRISIAPGQQQEIILHAAAAGTIRALLDSGHAPVGLTALARSAQGLTTSAISRDGVFLFDGLELGTYDLFLTDGASEDGARAVRVELAREGQMLTVRLPELPPRAPLRGHVVDAAGQAVPNASVQVRATRTGVPQTSASSDDDGYFELEGLSSIDYELIAHSAYGASNPQRVGPRDSSVRLVLEGYAFLSGSARLSSGEPVDAFVLHLERDGTSRSIDGSNGRWSMPGSTPGSYRVRLTSDSGNAEANVQLLPGEERELALVVTARAATDAPPSQ